MAWTRRRWLSAFALGTVIVFALATWILTPAITGTTTSAELSGLYTAVTIGSLGAFVLSMVNSFKRVIKGCPVPVIVAGGLKTSTDLELLEQARIVPLLYEEDESSVRFVDLDGALAERLA